VPALLAAAVTLLLIVPAATAGAAERAEVIGSAQAREMVESFLVPTLPRAVRIEIAPCPGDPSAQGCHSSGARLDTIWLNAQAGGLDAETVAHEMGHVFESYMWDRRWEGAPNSSFVSKDFFRIAQILFEAPRPGILYSTAWSERFAESYSACARFPELSETLYTGYYGFEMTPAQHDQICPLIARMAAEYEEASAPVPSFRRARPLSHRPRP
jgi:hypothetical protein